MLAGCEAYDSLPPETEPPLAARAQAVEQRMHARYTEALGVEASIARGDLDRARRQARVIDALDEPELLERWRPYLELVRVDAHRVAIAESLDTAAERAASLGRACARCHEASRARVEFAEIAAPSAHATLAEDMSRHQWAALQMWEGLIGPDDALWRTGAAGLTAMPANILAQAMTRSESDDVDDVARIKLYAARAPGTVDQDARADLFGRILATCAHCHAALRDR